MLTQPDPPPTLARRCRCSRFVGLAPAEDACHTWCKKPSVELSDARCRVPSARVSSQRERHERKIPTQPTVNAYFHSTDLSDCWCREICRDQSRDPMMRRSCPSTKIPAQSFRLGLCRISLGTALEYCCVMGSRPDDIQECVRFDCWLCITRFSM